MLSPYLRQGDSVQTPAKLETGGHVDDVVHLAVCGIVIVIFVVIFCLSTVFTCLS